MTEKNTQSPVHLRAGHDDERHFLLQPEDNDLFVRTGKQVIDHCRLGISVEVWFQEVDSMLLAVREWAAKRSDRLVACFCVPKGTRVILFFVPTSPSFDFELADELADLGATFARDFNVGGVEVRQIPGGEADRFIDTERAKLVYGHLPTPPRPVDA